MLKKHLYGTRKFFTVLSNSTLSCELTDSLKDTVRQDYILQRGAKVSLPYFALFGGVYAHILTYIYNLRSVKNAAASLLLASLIVRRLFSKYFIAIFISKLLVQS